METPLKLSKAIKALRYSAWRAASHIKCSPSNQSFTPFIVVTRSRSGSNLLKNFLNSSRRVECFGEVFRHPDRLGWDRPGILPKNFGLSSYLADPVEFLQNYFLEQQPPWVSAAGFKLFYYHAREPHRQTLWDFLHQRTDIHIIHLRRRNLIKVIVSRELAMKTGVWIDHSGDKGPLQSVKISPEYFEQQIKDTQNWEATTQEFFSKHPVKEIIFEDLIKTPQAHLDDLSQFLNIDQGDLRPISATKKQAKRPLSEMLSNFEEVKKHFIATPWEKYFA